MKTISSKDAEKISFIHNNCDELFKTKDECIDLVPNLNLKKAKSFLNDELWWLNDEAGNLEFKNSETPYHDEKYVGIYAAFGSRLTPVGAQVLVEILLSGKLGNGGNDYDLQALKDYADSLEKLHEQACKTVAKGKQVKEREKYLLDNPQDIKQHEMTFDLIEQYFWKKIGGFIGTRKLEIGKYFAEKSVSLGQLSNSGKTRSNPRVEIIVRDENGQIILDSNNGVVHPSKNRRNDPDRDWGLPND